MLGHRLLCYRIHHLLCVHPYDQIPGNLLPCVQTCCNCSKLHHRLLSGHPPVRVPAVSSESTATTIPPISSTKGAATTTSAITRSRFFNFYFLSINFLTI